MGKVFRIVEAPDGTRKVDKEEFYVGLKDLGVKITKKEAEALLDYLDTSDDGYVNYDEFLVGIRGVPNAERQAVIDQAFNKFDKDGYGFLNSADLKVVFDSTQHPKVLSGEETEDEIFTQFLTHFGDKHRDGRITKPEWNDYYAATSATISNDYSFVDLMTTAWKL